MFIIYTWQLAGHQLCKLDLFSSAQKVEDIDITTFQHNLALSALTIVEFLFDLSIIQFNSILEQKRVVNKIIRQAKSDNSSEKVQDLTKLSRTVDSLFGRTESPKPLEHKSIPIMTKSFNYYFSEKICQIHQSSEAH